MRDVEPEVLAVSRSVGRSRLERRNGAAGGEEMSDVTKKYLIEDAYPCSLRRIGGRSLVLIVATLGVP